MVQWKCDRCDYPLEKQDITEKKAEIVEGMLLCARCLEGSRRKARQARLLKIRCALAAAVGLLLLVVLLIFRVHSLGKERQSQRDKVLAVNTEVLAALKQDRFVLASQKVDELKAALQAHAALFDSQESEQLLQAGREGLRTWLDGHFPDLGEFEQQILRRLLLICRGPDNDLGRLQAVRADESKLTLTVVCTQRRESQRVEAQPDEACDPSVIRNRMHGAETQKDPRLEEAQAFLATLFEQFPKMPCIELTWLDAESHERIEVYRLTREQFNSQSQQPADSMQTVPPQQ